MVAFVGFAVFASALAVSIGTIAAMIAPQWRRVLSLAMGRTEPAFTPLARLAVAERRIAVRRWATASWTAPVATGRFDRSAA